MKRLQDGTEVRFPWCSQARAIYRTLNGTMYQDVGPNHFDARAKERQKNRLVKRLADLGYAVEPRSTS